VTTTTRPESRERRDGRSTRRTYFRHQGISTAERDRLRTAFASAHPFPHAVFDDFITAGADEVVPQFPGPDWNGWEKLVEKYQGGKASCSEIERIPSPLKEMVEELGSPSFLRFLEEISGLDGLISDPYLEGGGLHVSGSGGILAPHTDFHIYPRLGLYRRLNVIVYLNPAWQPEYGGSLVLYDGNEKPAQRVVPEWGRCVVFATDDRSVHGFPEPVVEGRVRRSMATYYYTSHEAAGFSGDTTTLWREHGEEGMGVLARARLGAYKGLLRGSRFLSRTAHFVNPNKRQRD